MIRKICLIFACLAVPATLLVAAPVTPKELDLMVRMHTPDDEILGDVAKRRLLAPLDDGSAARLASEGASAALIDKLKKGDYAIPPEQAAAEVRRVAEQGVLVSREKARDEAAYAAYQRGLTAEVPTSDNLVRLLSGKLVHLEDGAIRPYSENELKRVRYFAFYYSASWCNPCRQFTPRLVEYYRAAKAQHPEFEIVLVSSDKTAAAMEDYMKKDEMPWPAISFSRIDSTVRRFQADGIPYLAILDDAGVPLYPKSPETPAKSAPGKIAQAWVDPSVTLRVLDALLKDRQAVVPSAGPPR